MNDEQAKPLDLDTISLLIPQAREGSDTAREELLQHIQSYLALMAAKNNVQHLQAKFGNSDIVQQSLAQVIQGFDQFRGESSKEFYGWLNQIVANEAKQLQRDHHRQKRDVKRERRMQSEQSGSDVVGFVPQDGQPTPSSNAMAREELRQFTDALEKLPADYAEVVRLRSLESLPFQQVAEKMDRTVDSVRKIWYRAIVKLQQEVDSKEPNDEQQS